MIKQYDECVEYGGFSGPVMFTGSLSRASENFLDGYHGLHVHAGSDISSCSSLGGHMTVDDNEIHGPSSFALPQRHAGDLGNIMVTNMSAMVNINDDVLSLDSSSPYYIGYRGMVLHALMDDENPARDPSSTGAAGARVGCCLITSSSTHNNRQIESKRALIFLSFPCT